MARVVRALDPAVAAEVREALGHKRRAGQDFETAWAAVLRGLPASQREQLRRDMVHWRLGYERAGGTSVLRQLDVSVSSPLHCAHGARVRI